MSEHEALYHVNLTTHNIKMIPKKTSEIFRSKKSNQASKQASNDRKQIFSNSNNERNGISFLQKKVFEHIIVKRRITYIHIPSNKNQVSMHHRT